MVMIKLKSNDGKIFEVEDAVANMSVTLRTMLENLGTNENDSTPIPIPKISGPILALVLRWSEYHRNDPPRIDDDDDQRERRSELADWDAEFLRVDQSTLMQLIIAANYLEIKGLLDSACMTVANMIRGKTPGEIRQHFRIKNDFTPEEEEAIRRENECFEETQ